MKRKRKDESLLTKLKNQPKKWTVFKIIPLILSFFLAGWFFVNTINLLTAASQPVNAFLVLGGSIQREVHVAELAKQFPDTPILISQGSQDPCVVNIFREKAANPQNTWLEKCANSTFENFYYSLPILQRWNVKKIKLITSAKHLPRALWLGQIIFGAHGIWVEPEIVKEPGIPANYESWFKTGLDLGRSVAWAGLSHLIQPHCSEVRKLSDVDMEAWQKQKFRCEYRPKT